MLGCFNDGSNTSLSPGHLCWQTKGNESYQASSDSSKEPEEEKMSKTSHSDTEKLVSEELSKGLIYNTCKGCWKESCVRYLLYKCSQGEKKKNKLQTHTHFLLISCVTLQCFSLSPRNKATFLEKATDVPKRNPEKTTALWRHKPSLSMFF